MIIKNMDYLVKRKIFADLKNLTMETLGKFVQKTDRKYIKTLSLLKPTLIPKSRPKKVFKNFKKCYTHAHPKTGKKLLTKPILKDFQMAKQKSLQGHLMIGKSNMKVAVVKN